MQSELDIQNFKGLLEEYEALVPTLNEQLGFYKSEHQQLKTEIINLTEENKLLSTKLEESLSKQTLRSAECRHQFSEVDLVKNLKSQLTLSIKEKESVKELWQASLKTIDHLEGELRYYEGDFKSKNMMYKVKKKHLEEVAHLKEEIKKSHINLKEALKTSTAMIQTKTTELMQTIESQNKAIAQISKLEDDMNLLQEKYVDVFKIKETLAKKLDEKNTIIANLKIEASASKAKVAEACQLIEAALFERDGAVGREREAKDEILRLSKELSESMGCISATLKKDVEEMKEEYNDKIRKLRKDLATAQEAVSATTLDIEKRKMQCKQLEEEIERSRASNFQHGHTNTSQMMIIENNLESTFQKLLLSERKNVQLSSEIELLKDDLKQMAMHYEKDINMREIEKKTHQTKIFNLQNELQTSNLTLMQVASKVESLNNKIIYMDSEFKKEFQIKNVKSERILSEKISEVEQSNHKINDELRMQLESQIILNKKWKSEVREIIGSLEKRIQDLRGEIKEFQQDKIALMNKLSTSEKKCAEYREHLEVLCNEFNKMTNKCSER